MSRLIAITFSFAILLICTWATAHDTWVETNVGIVRTGDAVTIDLMLGNHGNEHRDFKLAGKADLGGSTLEVVDPDGKRFDLKPSMVDQGYAPKEGFWRGSFQPAKPGMYLVAQSAEAVASYAPERIVRSAKTFFLASDSLDEVATEQSGFDRKLGHAMEIVPLSNTVSPMGPGVPLKMQLFYKGKPLVNERVSFIPRGQVLTGQLDATYERMTDQNGCATFEPKEANSYLIAAHHTETGEKGDGYTSTKYSATLTVIVPAICPCCGPESSAPALVSPVPSPSPADK